MFRVRRVGKHVEESKLRCPPAPDDSVNSNSPEAVWVDNPIGNSGGRLTVTGERASYFTILGRGTFKG